MLIRKGPRSRFLGTAFRAADSRDVLRLAEATGTTVTRLGESLGGVAVDLVDPSGMRVRVVSDTHELASLPGQKLFQYSEGGSVHPVTSNDVNAYLREVFGEDFTAKHFRTWNASVIAFGALREGLPLKAMLERVSQALGNTPSIARKAYVHPLLIEAARTGEIQGCKLPRQTQFHNREERGLIAFLGTRRS